MVKIPDRIVCAISKIFAFDSAKVVEIAATSNGMQISLQDIELHKHKHDS